MDHDTTMRGLLTLPGALEPQTCRSRPLPMLSRLGFVLAILALLGLAVYYL